MRLLLLLLIATLCGHAHAQSRLKNGGLNDGETFPTGWQQAVADQGKVRATRDTSDKAEGSSSLRLQSVEGAAKGKVYQEMVLTPGERLRISGQAKATEGISYGVVALVTPGAQQAWNEIANFTRDRKWQRFEKIFQVPDGGEHGLLMLYFTGDGSVWLDDVKVALGVDDPQPQSNDDRILTDFNEPFSFTYLGFDKGVSGQGGIAVIRTKDGKGGAGIHMKQDWSKFASYSPAIHLRLGPGNKASQIKLQLTDGSKGKTNFTYELSGANQESFQRLLPSDAKSLNVSEFDPSNVTGLHIQGDWRADEIDVQIDKVEFVAPTADMLAIREKAVAQEQRAAERKRQEAERKRQARDTMLASGSEHPADGPEVVHIGAAGADMLGIEIQAGRIPPAAPVPYVKRNGDIHKPSGDDKLAWLDGKPAIVPAGFEIQRVLSKNGRSKKVGQLNLYENTLWNQTREGAELDMDVVDEPRTYRVSIDGQDPITPVAVYRKSKPNTIAQVSGQVMAQHFVYLKLRESLKEGSTYSVQFFALNTREAAAEYRHDSKTARCEAIHVSHLGYRRDDPLKRAYFSLWAGTGGGQSFDVEQFQLLDESGKTVYTGQIQMGIPADQVEVFANERNHTQANVYHLDFGDFDVEGTFVVHAPGLGVSYPFSIRPSAWEDAFRVSMHGFLTHRSGIELGPPLTGYVRPRNMHPDDGFVVYKTDVTIWDGESDAIAASLKRLLGEDLDASRLEKHPEAWGGYMDAGDWDRRSQHLIASLRHLELLEMFPEKFTTLELALPANESNNNIPDILDEALWNLDFYRRLQEPGGGVGGGVESTAHPRPGEASWQETLLAGAFRPDPETTYRYAAVAAKAARLLDDHPRAAELRSSAERAWQWAQANAEAEIRAAIQRNAKKASSAAKATAKMQTLAAIELFHLTGDKQFSDALLEIDVDALSDADIAMCYALLPSEQADPDFRKRVVSSIVQTADAAIQVSIKNGFNVAPPTRYLPMMGYTCIWSTPGSTAPPVLPRAHFLTGEERYLFATIAACQYSGGANPMNMSYTTGIGPRQPLAPLHIDSRVSGQAPPAGITVYGQSDPSMGYGFDEFAHTWFLNRYGGVNSKSWPTAEAYIDLGNWPAMNEYTVHQALSPTSYTWGYLAGRGGEN